MSRVVVEDGKTRVSSVFTEKSPNMVGIGSYLYPVGTYHLFSSTNGDTVEYTL